MPIRVTLVAGAAVSAAPTFVSFQPPELQGMLTAILALGTGAYHLYQPTPGAPAAKQA